MLGIGGLARKYLQIEDTTYSTSSNNMSGAEPGLDEGGPILGAFVLSR